MPGRDEIIGLGARVDRDLDGEGALARGDSGADPGTGVDADRECRAVGRAVVVGHHGQPQGLDPILGQGETDEPPAVAGHEVDGLGRDQIRGQGQVALVLAILVVDHDDQLAGADVLDGLGDRDVGTSGHGCFRRSGRLAWRSCRLRD